MSSGGMETTTSKRNDTNNPTGRLAFAFLKDAKNYRYSGPLHIKETKEAPNSISMCDVSRVSGLRVPWTKPRLVVWEPGNTHTDGMYLNPVE